MLFRDLYRNGVISRIGYVIRLLWFPALCGILAVVASNKATSSDGPLPERQRVETAALVTPVLSARRLPGVIAHPDRLSRLRANLTPFLGEIPADSSCIQVATPNGSPVFSHNATTALTPASSLKLVTANAALAILGPEYRFRTALVSDTPVVNGTVAGDVWLIGSGDPILATADYASSFENQPQLRTPFEQLATEIRNAGITRVDGALAADPTRYDDNLYVGTWPFAFRTGFGDVPAGTLTALNLNDGFTRWPSEGQLFGGLGYRESTQNPPLRTVDTLVGLLEDDVVFGEGTRVAKAPPAPIELAAIESPPLSEIVAHMLSESDNTTAELLVKEIGFRQTQLGSTDAGVAAIKAFYEARGVPLDSWIMSDGSGLDTSNKISCAALVTVVAQAGPDSPIQLNLAVANRTGTLVDRYEESPAAGRVRAKTGRLNGVSSLTGVVDAAGDEELIFSFIFNDTNPDAIKLVEERITEAMLSWPGGPTDERLGPKPVEQ